MKTTKITFSRLFNTGNFEHEKYEVEIELNSLHDTESDAFEHAHKIVNAAYLRGKQLTIDFDREHYTK